MARISVGAVGRRLAAIGEDLTDERVQQASTAPPTPAAPTTIVLPGYLEIAHILTEPTKTVEPSFDADDLVRVTGHGYDTGDRVKFTFLDGGSSLEEEKEYVVINPEANTFQLSDSPIGDPFDFGSDITNGTIGQMLPRDTEHIVVHIGFTVDFTPAQGTVAGSLTANPSAQRAGVDPAVRIPIEDSSNRWVRVVAVNASGKMSTPSAPTGPHNVSGAGDVFSGNWDGNIPANLTATFDALAAVGFYIDSSAGAMQLMGSMWLGGDMALFGGGTIDTRESGVLRGLKVKGGVVEFLDDAGALQGLINSTTGFGGGFDLSWVSGAGSHSQRLAIRETHVAISGVPLRLVFGSASAPALSFFGETNMGFYRKAAGQLGVAVGGNDVATFMAGQILVGGFTVFHSGNHFTSGTNTAHVLGNISGHTSAAHNGFNHTGHTLGNISGHTASAHSSLTFSHTGHDLGTTASAPLLWAGSGAQGWRRSTSSSQLKSDRGIITATDAWTIMPTFPSRYFISLHDGDDSRIKMAGFFYEEVRDVWRAGAPEPEPEDGLGNYDVRAIVALHHPAILDLKDRIVDLETRLAVLEAV